MAGKIGEEFVRDMIDRGRRELGGVLFHDSNVAQQMYPLRGHGISKEVDSPGLEEHGSIMGDRQEAEVNRDDPDRGMERE
jgi:hypothetical protein